MGRPQEVTMPEIHLGCHVGAEILALVSNWLS